MPARYFTPKDGFADKRVAAVKVDTIDGYSTSAEILTDGTERPTDSGANHLRQSIPLWTAEELSRLVAGGSWNELDAPPQTAGDAGKDQSPDKPAEATHDAPRDEPAVPSRARHPQPVEDPNA